MKLRTVFLAGFTALLFSIGPAFADACSDRARAFANGKPNVTVLSVDKVVKNNGKVVCVARVKIGGKNGKPPRIVTKQFNP